MKRDLVRAIAIFLAVVIISVGGIGGPALAQDGDLVIREKQVADLYNSGKYKDAAALAAQLVESAAIRHGREHVVYASAIRWHALALWQQGEYTGVEDMLRRSLAIFEREFAQEHTEVAEALNNLASFLQVLGRFADAEPLMVRALTMVEKLQEPEHPNVGRYSNNLGLMYLEQGRYGEAEPLLLRARAITEKTRPESDPGLSNRLRNLATLYRALARYEEAETLLRRVLSLNETHLGPDNPAVANVHGALGRLYLEMGRFREAVLHHKRALEIREKAYGASNIFLATSLNNLAMVYRELGQYAEAEQLVTRALAIRERSLGPTHHEVAQSVTLLAGIMEGAGRLDNAEALYRRALTVQEKALQPDHPDLAATRTNLGALYKRAGRYGAARSLLETALATREKVLGPNHPAVAASLIQLSDLHRLQGNRSEAEKLLQRARGIRRSGIKEIPIFFATDRKMEPRGGVIFGRERDSDNVTFGVAEISIVNAPATAERARASIARSRRELEENTDPGRISIAPPDIIAGSAQLVEAAQQKLLASQAYRRQALLYVHGYNMSFDDAMRRAGQIAYDLDFDGPTFVFSWPSREGLFGYFEDRETVDIATEHLKEFLQTVIIQLKATKVHLIAHSMGNLVLLRTFADSSVAAGLAPTIGEIVSAAPDVDPDAYRRFARQVKAHGGNLTVYASAADWALRVSGWFRSRPRVGYVVDGNPTLTVGVDTIDITRAGMNLFAINHDVYASNPIIIGDIRRILAGDRPPHERTKQFKRKSSPSGMFWAYEPFVEEDSVQNRN